MRKGDQPFTQNTSEATSVSKRYFYSAACSHWAHTPALRVKRLDGQKKKVLRRRKQREEFSGNKLEEFALWQNSSSFWLCLINLYGIEPSCTEGLTQRSMIFMCVCEGLCFIYEYVCVRTHTLKKKKKSFQPSSAHSPRFWLLQAHRTPTHGHTHVSPRGGS